MEFRGRFPNGIWYGWRPRHRESLAFLYARYLLPQTNGEHQSWLHRELYRHRARLPDPSPPDHAAQPFLRQYAAPVLWQPGHTGRHRHRELVLELWEWTNLGRTESDSHLFP